MKNIVFINLKRITKQPLSVFACCVMVLVGASACEQVIPLDVEPHQPLLNLQAVLIGGDSLMGSIPNDRGFQTTISASNTVGAFANDQIRFLKDATIDVYVNNTFDERLVAQNTGMRFDNRGNFDTIWSFFPTNQLEEGRRYEIRASHPNFDGPVVGAQQLPLKPSAFASTRVNDPEETRLRFVLEDLPGQQQYFIRVNTIDSFGGFLGGNEFFSCVTPGFSSLSQWDDFDFEDPNGVPITYQGLLSDRNFDGQNVEVELIVYASFSNVNVSLVVEVISITKDFETYLRTFYRNQNNQFNPFAEPSTIYQNVSRNGAGVVLAGTRKVLLF
jgi:hypothetical protein